jgi:cell wall-associated NlpC family hydrolase
VRRTPDQGIILSRISSLYVKRALALLVLTAVAILPMLSAHPAAARAATTQAAAITQTASASQADAATQTASASQADAATQAAATAQTAITTKAATATQAAIAARTHHRRTRRMRAYRWAASQRGKPYCWGGTGGCFDCSGLVMAAYRHVGLNIGRDTSDMLASSRLIRIGRRHAKKGDLAFYGTGHVELVAGRRLTLGALHQGTVIGWHRRSVWWHPTMYFRIRGAGRRNG